MGLDSAHRIARVPLDGSSQKRKRHGVTAPETVGGCAHFANDALQLTHQLHEKHNQQRDTDQPAVMRMERYFATQSVSPMDVSLHRIFEVDADGAVSAKR